MSIKMKYEDRFGSPERKNTSKIKTKISQRNDELRNHQNYQFWPSQVGVSIEKDESSKPTKIIIIIIKERKNHPRPKLILNS